MSTRPPYIVRSKVGQSVSTHPAGGYFGKPLVHEIPTLERASVVANDVQRECGAKAVVWVEDANGEKVFEADVTTFSRGDGKGSEGCQNDARDSRP